MAAPAVTEEIPLNEWMRCHTENPSAFEAEFQTVNTFLIELADGTTPDYGERCATFLHSLVPSGSETSSDCEERVLPGGREVLSGQQFADHLNRTEG